MKTDNFEPNVQAQPPRTSGGDFSDDDQSGRSAASCSAGIDHSLGDPPHSIAYIKPGTKLTLLVDTESQAKDLYNSMGEHHRKALRCAWGQAEPRRIDGVYPHTDLQRDTPHFVQEVAACGCLVFRQL